MPRRPASERRVVELGSTLKLQPTASPHPVHDELFGGTGTIAGAQAEPSPGAGRRRKKPPGMARRSTRHWARPARQPETEADEQERPPQPQRQPEPEPEPELEPEPEQEEELEEPEPRLAGIEGLVTAAAAGDGREVERLITSGVDMNGIADQFADPTKASHGETTALIAAAAHGQTSVVTQLLQAGADWELRDAAGKSALERAEGEDTAAVLGAWIAEAELRAEMDRHNSTADVDKLNPASPWVKYTCGAMAPLYYNDETDTPSLAPPDEGICHEENVGRSEGGEQSPADAERWFQEQVAAASRSEGRS